MNITPIYNSGVIYTKKLRSEPYKICN